MLELPSRLLLPIGLLLGASGCVLQTPNSIKSVWADYNTLNEPAIFVEKIDRLPYPRARVDYFRWMYSQGPGAGVAPQLVPGFPPAAEALHPHTPVPSSGRSERPPSGEGPDTGDHADPAAKEHPPGSSTPAGRRTTGSDGPTAASDGWLHPASHRRSNHASAANLAPDPFETVSAVRREAPVRRPPGSWLFSRP